MIEEWLPVVGFEGYYQVSNFGRIRRVKSQRILKPFVNALGYHVFTLSKEGWRLTIQVHRLVIYAFKGACPSGHEVDHVDGNPSNNSVSNLRYLTRSGNIQAAMKRRGKWQKVPFGEEHMGARLSTAQIAEIRRLRIEGMKYADIAMEFGISRHHASDIFRGKVRTRG